MEGERKSFSTRIRLVGRPGRRFAELIGGPHGQAPPPPLRADPDPKTSLLAGVHTELRQFYGIVGGSDLTDEEEFLGFTEADIQDTLNQSNALLATLTRLEELRAIVRQHSLKKYPDRGSLQTSLPLVERKSRSRTDHSADLDRDSATIKIKTEAIFPTSVTASPVKTSLRRDRLSLSQKKSLSGSIKVRLAGVNATSLDVPSNKTVGSISSDTNVTGKASDAFAKKRRYGVGNSTFSNKLSHQIRNKPLDNSSNVNCRSQADGHSRPLLFGRGRSWRKWPMKKIDEPNNEKSTSPTTQSDVSREVWVKQARFSAVMAPAVVEPERKIPSFDAPLIVEGKRERKPHAKILEKWARERLKQDVASISKVNNSNELDFIVSSYSALPAKQVRGRPIGVTMNVLQRKIERARLYVTSRMAVRRKICGHVVMTTDGDQRKSRKRTCCVCRSHLLLAHHYGCSELICRACARYYKKKLDTPNVVEQLVCPRKGKCSTLNVSARGDKPFCSACKFKKCLEFYALNHEKQGKIGSMTSQKSNQSESESAKKTAKSEFGSSRKTSISEPESTQITIKTETESAKKTRYSESEPTIKTTLSDSEIRLSNENLSSSRRPSVVKTLWKSSKPSATSRASWLSKWKIGRSIVPNTPATDNVQYENTSISDTDMQSNVNDELSDNDFESAVDASSKTLEMSVEKIKRRNKTDAEKSVEKVRRRKKTGELSTEDKPESNRENVENSNTDGVLSTKSNKKSLSATDAYKGHISTRKTPKSFR